MRTLPRSLFSGDAIDLTESRQPRKVKRSLHEARSMLKSIFVRAPLSDQLREKYRRRAVTVREGDTVKIVRGDFKNVEGKVQKVDVKEGRLFVEGVTRQKVKGGTTQLSVSASKVLVTGLSLDDKRRKSRLEQGGAS